MSDVSVRCNEARANILLWALDKQKKIRATEKTGGDKRLVEARENGGAENKEAGEVDRHVRPSGERCLAPSRPTQHTDHLWNTKTQR